MENNEKQPVAQETESPKENSIPNPTVHPDEYPKEKTVNIRFTVREDGISVEIERNGSFSPIEMYGLLEYARFAIKERNGDPAN